MKTLQWLTVAGILSLPLIAYSGQDSSSESAAGTPAESLRSAQDFADINNEEKRSAAMFEELGKVIQHPRCMNCHPAGNQPLQGMDMTVHEPPVERGPANFGTPGMECNTCHQSENVTLAAQAKDIKSVPGNPKWHLAPIEMAWVGKSLTQICEQIKDKERNGNKTMEEMIHHMAKDDLVGWGWKPGEGREPAPGTQKSFGELFEAWVHSGAHCPSA
ncbi:Isoquinoline 1-oxidoreductase subunit [Salinimonas sp. HHU 13199]|uniref:Isoquinoline 1-oxidoreductase subunit n=1 Tax=Salinimonas profundi TaxID=2729140 RepID=A0ABR8LF88_9ALTE|nr:Isoquinoline 1-oxidoreductase subunit [Salinimonas profundi]MBD3584392.1 Isoquinoline 1-oxidoreductase subunit [Salinimonas profundi]